MAESAVTFLLKKLIAALHHEEVKLLRGVWGEVTYIKDELERMTAFLNVADQASHESDEELKVWVKQVRDVVYDTNDVLDEFKLHVENHHHRQQGFFRSFLNFFHSILDLKARHRIASRMKHIKTRVRNISEGRQRYRYKCNIVEEGSTSSTVPNSTWHDCRGDALLVEEAELVGIDKRKKQLIEHLLEDEPELKIISVVGMGGMGKTTLVRKIYQDSKVKRHFQTHVWITVSQTFVVEEFLKDIIVQLFAEIKQPVPQGINDMGSHDLKMQINEFLSQKRYVIVLDDIWRIDACKALKYALPTCQCGSRVMLTTRIADIASTTSTIFDGSVTYPLEPLSREESWNLFCRKTFKADTCPPHLNEISRRILRRCEGLPLAIAAISGLLATKDKGKIDQWEIVQRSLGAHIEGDDKLGSMKRILSLSYDELPGYLKACFLYFSIFPNNYLIKRMRLIRLWVAEGFVEEREGQMPEEIAESYLNELVNRSLVQIATTTRNGRVSTCRIHDLLREISLSKSRELNFVAIANINNTQWLERIRRLSIHKTCRNVEKSKRFSHVRSLFTFGVADMPSKLPISTLLSGVPRLLKVLDLQGAPLESLPNEIFELYLLRYLSLKGTSVKKIPSSIGRLVNLETLDLKHASVTELPVEILKLQKLRHLLVYRYVKRSPPFHSTYGFKPPLGLGDLPSLQKLCFVEATQSSDILNEVGKLTQLRKLGITKLRREDGVALCSSIENLRNLRSLDVNSIEEDEVIDVHHMSSPPPYLQRLWLQGRLETLPPWITSMHSLVKLRLRWSRLSVDPLESLQALPNLVELQLRQAYDGDVLQFKAGGFQGLKVLHLHDLEALRRVSVEDGAMPHLEDLRIICCKSLENVPAGIEFLTNLKSLAFADMNNELIMRLLGKQGDDYLKIMNIPEAYYTFWDCGRWNRASLSNRVLAMVSPPPQSFGEISMI